MSSNAMDQHRDENDAPSKQEEQRQAKYAPSEPGELVRDWQLLFWIFLFSAVAELVCIFLWPPTNVMFHLGVSCGLLLAGLLGFAMRYLLSQE